MALPSDERQRPWQLDLVAHINNSLQVDGTMLADVWNQVITEGGTRPKDIFNTDLDPRHLKIEERGTHLLLQYDHANLLEESITKEGSEADEADEAETLSDQSVPESVDEIIAAVMEDFDTSYDKFKEQRGEEKTSQADDDDQTARREKMLVLDMNDILHGHKSVHISSEFPDRTPDEAQKYLFLKHVLNDCPDDWLLIMTCLVTLLLVTMDGWIVPNPASHVGQAE